ncbi:hypothetical protein [Dorea sp. AM58-8]|uniref:hypothetical protein n=1 Tax=Dorea sp. AM58-8 TaxID=2292346 RepID=UPI000E467987|nr:hypothetical protein [Dorea sp. AM58-8]RGY79905.1 hypothetical protein DXA18_11405 [Dorea sp. AM58-8]
MASYYYLISSLPDLRTDGDMPMTYDEFLDVCQSNVSESKYELLKNLTLSSEEGPLLKEWSAFYKNLMGELNYQRSVSLGRPYLTSYDKDSVIAQVAGAAMAAKNPLEAEKILLECEFDNLDSLVGLHTFDDRYLFGYAIKLKLLERQSCFVQSKGQKEFKRLFDQVQQRVYSL